MRAGQGARPVQSVPLALRRAGGHVKPDARLLLQSADDAEEVARLRVAARAEHADQAFGGRAGGLRELLEADGGLDVIAQDGFAGVDVAGQQGVDAFLGRMSQ